MVSVWLELRSRMASLVDTDSFFRPGRVGVLLATFPDPSENGVVALLGSVPCQGPRDFCV